ncbi:uncharacterized protein LOC120154833 [Hibiscus syriacus]|uniref:uncharacterized protein LOC120154833 n=1 Tax=Hibiscus syriacus TaxID=106335 RepID=UPI00192173D3|nr:uncharacterized protein LOC120154833 [Hibiscus syriacus]
MKNHVEDDTHPLFGCGRLVQRVDEVIDGERSNDGVMNLDTKLQTQFVGDPNATTCNFSKMSCSLPTSRSFWELALPKFLWKLQSFIPIPETWRCSLIIRTTLDARKGERNERLFYKLLIDKAEELPPVVYTPTIGEAFQKYGDNVRRSQYLYISLKEGGTILEVLKN